MSRNRSKRTHRKKTMRGLTEARSSFLLISINTFVWFSIIIFFALTWLYITLPDVSEKLSPSRHPSITLTASDGTVLAKIGNVYGKPIKYKNIPPTLIHAVLATEDRRFYSHIGIDIFGTLRALWANIKAGRITQGGSTITQQLAKNLFLKPERSYKRKIQELMLAFWIEYHFSKNQIITLYLNRVYFGAGTYGIDAAARKYFGKPVRKIDLWQSAMLAGLLKAPSRYNPFANINLATIRANLVLRNMVSIGYVTQTQADGVNRKNSNIRKRTKTRIAPYFVDWVLNQIQDYVGRPDSDLIILTTLRPHLQEKAENVLKTSLTNTKTKYRKPQVSLVSMDPNGAVLGMVGGRNYKKSQFNRATQAHRQPGSAFKPIIYLSALEAGMTPSTTIVDSPINEAGWKPRNFDNSYRGKVTLLEALTKSINTVAIRVAKKVGLNQVVKKANNLGIRINTKSDSSIALGTAEVTPLALTAAYATFANGGFGVWPYGIVEIRDFSDNLLYRRHGSGLGKAMDKTHATSITKMLQNVIVRGTGKNAAIDRPAAGKTGTSQNFRDAWFIGYTPNMVTSVWLGNDDNLPMNNITGGGMPAKIWREFMLTAHKGIPKKTFSILPLIGS
ncbi:MAG: Penicillin-binding protein 2D [Alphaproteobacteria bacterium MarineAlpha3_Bin5]|nr:penicillin-binding protein [Magnetovibrio sp.]PPR79763.1 MAG: Penicillin-binding protein 2D [Alphaproteobacteria bacterium MarineAlpha3_Bin5]